MRIETMRLCLSLLYLGHALSEAIFLRSVGPTVSRFATALEVPPHFLMQLFAIEDKWFSFHAGIDPVAIVRAGSNDLLGNGALQGASTITQQLHNCRQEHEGICHNRTFSGKLMQATWALKEDLRKSKQEILSEYLNTVYWGVSYYGIDKAASSYFNCTRQRLTVAQSFFLAERLANPNIVVVDRVVTLLQRHALSAMLSSDRSALEELVLIYDDHFGCGGDICECLVKFPKKSVVRMPQC